MRKKTQMPTNYTSLLSLSTRLLDTMNVYTLPFVSLFTFTCSFISMIVLANKRLKGIVYQHLLLDSIAAIIYAASNSFTFLIRCGALCSYGYTYWSKFYELHFYVYVGKSVELFILLLELNLSFMRLSSFELKAGNEKKTIFIFKVKLIN